MQRNKPAPQAGGAPKCLPADENPRNNFMFLMALIWSPGTSPLTRRISDVPSILIVGDDPAVQITIRLLLERAGHHVTAAGDGYR